MNQEQPNFSWSPKGSNSNRDFNINDAKSSSDTKTFKWSAHEAARAAQRRKAIEQEEKGKQEMLLDLEIGIQKFKIRSMEKILGYYHASQQNIKLDENNDVNNITENIEEEIEFDYDKYLNELDDPYYN